MSLKHWPQQEKPREKMLSQGVTSLSNAELLAILFNSGSRTKSAITLARDLITHYAGLQGLIQASYQSLSQHSGIGLAKYASIQAAVELNRRYLIEPVQRGQCGANSLELRNYLASELRGLEHEVFACVFLDCHLQLIRFEKLFSGTVDQTSVHPREIAKRALQLNASQIILAHNHPSGHIEPSRADHQLTQAIAQSLVFFDIQVVDHIIVGGNRTLSFAEMGYL